MRTRKRSTVVITALLGLYVVVSGGSFMAGDCSADLNSELYKEEKDDKVITYTFKVDLKSPERCADVEYVLTVVEAVPGEEDRTKETPHQTRVRDGVSVSAKVVYKMTRAHSLVSWNFEVAGCEPCGAAKPD